MKVHFLNNIFNEKIFVSYKTIILINKLYTCTIYHIFYPLKSSFRKGFIFLHIEIFLLMMSMQSYCAKQSGASTWNKHRYLQEPGKSLKRMKSWSAHHTKGVGRSQWAFYYICKIWQLISVFRKSLRPVEAL